MSTAGGEIMNHSDRKLLKGGESNVALIAVMTSHFDNNIFSESILLGALSRLGDAQTSQGRFPWKQRVGGAVCWAVVGGGAL